MKDSISQEVYESFVSLRWPRWVAPHLNLDNEYVNLNDNQLYIGEDSDDNKIYIYLVTEDVYIDLNENTYVNKSVGIFRKSLKKYAQVIEEINLAKVGSVRIPDRFFCEFMLFLEDCDIKALNEHSF